MQWDQLGVVVTYGTHSDASDTRDYGKSGIRFRSAWIMWV